MAPPTSTRIAIVADAVKTTHPSAIGHMFMFRGYHVGRWVATWRRGGGQLTWDQAQQLSALGFDVENHRNRFTFGAEPMTVDCDVQLAADILVSMSRGRLT